MKCSTALFLLLFTCAATAQTRSPLDLANAQVPPGAQRIAYGTDPLQFGELRVPSTKGPHPVAIVVHGGCWVAKLGNMDERAVALDNMRPVAAALTEAGIATWNVEYRRLGHAGGGWPGTFQDVARAADFLRTVADAHQMDLARVVAVGHSAGGHLAMWLAARSKVPRTSNLYVNNPLPLTGVVDLDGPPDLKATIPVQQPICGTPVITNLIGGSPDEQPDRYRAASPIELLPLGVRQELFAGRMFAAQVAPYETAAKRAGDVLQTTLLADAGHFVFIDPQSDVWPQVLAAVQRLLVKPEVAQAPSLPPQPLAIDGATAHVYKSIGGHQLRLHVFTPPNASPTVRKPAVVFFFGGGWTNGSVMQFVPQATHVASRGVVAVVADYRVFGRHGTSAFEAMADAKSALRWVRAHAAQLGVDPNRIAAAGGSAGGHIAVSAAVFDTFDEAGEDKTVSSKPNALVLFNPAVDTAQGAQSAVRDRFSARGRDGSPVHHLAAGLPTTLIMHGKADTTVPYADVERYCTEARKLGNQCQLAGYEGARHGFFNSDATAEKWRSQTLLEADRFLTRIGYPPEPAATQIR